VAPGLSKRWVVLATLAKQFGLKRFAEIGVRDGRMSGPLLDLIPDAHLIAVDPWQPCGSFYHWTPELHRRNERLFDQVSRRHPGRITKIKATSEEAALQVPDGSLDCAFIDGDHSYEAVSLDIRLWRPKVKPGGILSGHDYHNNIRYKDKFIGVDRAVDEAFPVVNSESDSVWWIQI